MAKCIGCPAGEQMDAEEVIATILGLVTGPNYRLDPKLLQLYSHINLRHFKSTQNLLRVAKAAMEAKFGSIWQDVEAFKTPTHANPLPDLFLQARSRRGGLAGRALTLPSILQRREEEMMNWDKEEEDGDSDSSVDIDMGSLLGNIL